MEAPSPLRHAALRVLFAGLALAALWMGLLGVGLATRGLRNVTSGRLLVFALAMAAVGLTAGPAAWIERAYPAGVRRGPVHPALLAFGASWLALAVLPYQVLLTVRGFARGVAPGALFLRELEVGPELLWHLLVAPLPVAVGLTWLTYLRWLGARTRSQLFQPAGFAGAIAVLMNTVPGAGPPDAGGILPLLYALTAVPCFSAAGWLADRVERRLWQLPPQPVAARSHSWTGCVLLLAGALAIAVIFTVPLGSTVRGGRWFLVASLAFNLVVLGLIGQRLKRRVLVQLTPSFAFGAVSTSAAPAWADPERLAGARASLAALGFTGDQDRLLSRGDAPVALCRFAARPDGVGATVVLLGPEFPEQAPQVSLVSVFPGDRHLQTTTRPLDSVTWATADDDSVLESTPGASPGDLLARHLAEREVLIERWGAPLRLDVAAVVKTNQQAIDDQRRLVARSWAIPFALRVLSFGEPARAARWPGPVPPRPEVSGDAPGSAATPAATPP